MRQFLSKNFNDHIRYFFKVFNIFLPLFNKKFCIIFELKHLCSNNLAGRSLVSCWNFDRCIHFSSSAGNSWGRGKLHPCRNCLEKLLPAKNRKNLQRKSKYLENEDAYSFLLILQSIFHSKLVLFFFILFNCNF